MTVYDNFHRSRVLALLVWMAMLLPVVGLHAQPLRNVLFNTPRSYQRDRLPLIHLNPDSVRMAAGYEHRMKVDDMVGVRFLNNLDITKGLALNQSESSSGGVPFLVNSDGEIDLPAVGKIRVLGMTKQEVKEAIEQKYAPQYVDPKVEISVLNLSVSVQGEVGAPGVYPLRREKTTLLEILSMAGGINSYGKRGVVKVVRGVAEGREPEILIFDLRQLDAIRTEDLYLQDKDVIYVEPRDIRVLSDAINPYAGLLTILTSIGTITVVVLNLKRN